jgi:serine/threonine-protein kinase
MGSPLYMSPEQLRRTRDVDARSDIWAIGVILHELLTGTAPFVGDSLAEVIASIVMAAPLSTRLRRPDVPRELEAVVVRCLEKDPDARFANVAELALALSPFAHERSRVSVERIVRVVAGRKEISLPPATADGRASRPVSTQMPTRVSATAEGTLARSATVVAPEEPPSKSPATDPSWQTSGVLRSARRGRRLAIGASVIAALGLAAVATVLVRRSAENPTPASAATTAAPAAPALTTAAAPSTPSPPASETPTEPLAVAAPVAIAPSVAPQRVVTNRAQTPSASPAVIAAPSTAPAPTPAPAPTKPGAADFGGRK